jgi:hypothetical protein
MELEGQVISMQMFETQQRQTVGLTQKRCELEMLWPTAEESAPPLVIHRFYIST